MTTIGLDLSLNGTGLVVLGTEGVPSEKNQTATLVAQELKPPRRKGKAINGPERLAWIEHRIMRVVNTAPNLQLVAIEDYAFGAKGRAIFQIGELGGVIRASLWSAGHDYVLVPPSCLKQYVTGRGNAGKPDMVTGVNRKWGHAMNEKIRSHNIADACGLAWYARAFLKHKRMQGTLVRGRSDVGPGQGKGHRGQWLQGLWHAINQGVEAPA